eukprot:Seg7346.1 transcript_id=Seg7346.1/GoldUCD/mRNA.D3Y31 product="hypothetical protein" protein_id=Seg7346.1/GoldUCD/D3Y31
MHRIRFECPVEKIRQVFPDTYAVKSDVGQLEYQVWLGSAEYLPSCQCLDYRKTRMPCKHICAVVNLPGVGWEALGSSFSTHPFFILDPVVVNPPENTTDDDSSHQINVQTMADEQSDGQSSDIVVEEVKVSTQKALPTRKMNRSRQKCIRALKSLHDNLYLLKNQDILNKIYDNISDALQIAKEHRPTENDLPLKDKSLSPKKARRSAAKAKITKYTQLKLRVNNKRKYQYCKRVGIAAENKRAKVVIAPNKDKKAIKGLSRKRKLHTTVAKSIDKDEQINVDEYICNEIVPSTEKWVTIGNTEMTTESKDVLLHPMGWLNDDHINAAQHILKEMGTGISGLQNVIRTTHWNLFDATPETFQSVQCHNIGNHWVVSTTVNGKVVVYDSLYTSLNLSLKKQLVYLYKNCSDDFGSLEVTVILQQKQTDGFHCGLYCIANATAIVNGIDPATVSWNERAMRNHLADCFEKKEITLFPIKAHNGRINSCQKKFYTVGIHCTCLQHVPQAKLVKCSQCANSYHYDVPRCIKLTVKQAASLLTKEPFICHRCESE